MILICVAVGEWWVWNNEQADVYQAKGSMLIAPRINVPGMDVYTEEKANFYGTQMKLMQSRQVLNAVQERLKPIEKEFRQPLEQQVFINRDKDTSIFIVTVNSTASEYSRRYADALMEEYIGYKKKIRKDTTQNTGQVIFRELEKIDRKRKDAEEKLFEFQRSGNLAYSDGQSDLAVQYLMELNRRLANVNTDMDFFNAGTIEQHFQGGDPTPYESRSLTLGGGFSSGGLDGSGGDRRFEMVNIEDSLTLLKNRKEVLGRIYQEAHPKMMALNEEIQIKQRMLDMAMDRKAREAETHFMFLLKQKQAYQVSLEKWEQKVLQVGQKSTEYAVLKAEVDRSNELYNLLVKRIQEIDLSNNLNQEEIAINENAVTSPQPVGPLRLKKLLTNLFFAIGAMCVIFKILKKIDDRIKTMDDLRILFPEPVLGQVPMLSGMKEQIRIVDLPSHNSFVESFRNLRSSLMFSPVSGTARTMAVTSAAPGDGKTTMAVNLAICLSQTDEGRTLLIDADMRIPKVHKYFNLSNRLGLSEILKGYASFGDCLMDGGISNLDILPSGMETEHTGELLMGHHFKEFLDSVSSVYQHVIIDTTPVLATDDVLSLAPMVDGVIFVVKAEKTSARMVNESLNLLKQRGCQIFGLVLNQISMRSGYYYYHHQYYRQHSSTPKALATQILPSGDGASRQSVG